ncbi:MAG: hypothetical protein ACRDP1_04225 [Nocardioidaceae bacterium]
MTPQRMWHVTLTLSGTPHSAPTVRAAMERLAEQHAFLHSLRYGRDRAEISYWEQADEMLDAAAMAMRVWNEHRDSAGLPKWEVVGLEVLERETFQARGGEPSRPSLGVYRPTPQPF